MSTQEKRNGALPKPAGARQRLDLRRDGVRFALGLLLLLLVNVAVYFWLIRPVHLRLEDLEQKKQSEQISEAEAEKNLHALVQTHAKVRDAEAKIQQFFEMISTRERRMVPFQSELMAVGREFNVIPRKVAISSGEMAREGLDQMGFGFPLSGTYHDLREFLARLEASSQFVIVRQVALGGGKEGGRMLELDIQVDTYFDNPELREQKIADLARKIKKKTTSRPLRQGRR